MKRLMRSLIILALVLVPSALLAQVSSLRCESNGNLHECRFEGLGSVRILRQLSRAACISGESWGYHGDVIWVDRGCRADFEITRRDREYGDRRGTSLVCESEGRRQFCAADTRFGVELSRQLSRRSCVEGRTWGYNDRGIWVDDGCRAEFLIRVGREGGYGHERRHRATVICESYHDRTVTCAADTRNGVEISRQLSSSACVLNRSWGYNSGGIWVTNGCRAEFTVWERDR